MNNWIKVSCDDESAGILQFILQFIEPEKKRKIRNRTITIPSKVNYLYNKRGDFLYIPIGVYDLISPIISKRKSIEIVDKRDSYDSILCEVSEFIENIDKYKNILSDDITLRPEQLLTIRKILFKKRCLCQLVTGSGKTEIMCATTKILRLIDNRTPTILILEPTKKLVHDTIKRFKKYNINVVDYSENRYIVENTVNICHPKSLCNDLEKNSELLNKVEVLFGDECHHLRSETFRKPTYNMENLVYSVGLSASAIDQEHVMSTNIKDYTFDELLVIGATGPLVINIKAELMLGDKLADPILLMFNNDANEPIKQIDDWNEVRTKRLQSDSRNTLIANITRFFSINERKILILVKTIEHAREILKKLYDRGLGPYARSSFGGGYFESYNGSDFVQDISDVFEEYSIGNYRIIIGTQHLIEGIDVPNLDVVILAYAGKSEKILIQSVGRVLRKTKTGKYAYIIDFNDKEDIILSKHSRTRIDKYKNVIGIPSNHMYINLELGDLPNIFSNLESCY